MENKTIIYILCYNRCIHIFKTEEEIYEHFKTLQRQCEMRIEKAKMRYRDRRANIMRTTTQFDF